MRLGARVDEYKLVNPLFECFVFPFHIGRFPRVARLDFQHANVFMRQSVSRLRHRGGIHAQCQHHLFGANLIRVVDHDHEGLTEIERLFHLIDRGL
jgi:hypothetical protein